ncbi:unnamed protein product, partial [marine sediment metagenome]
PGAQGEDPPAKGRVLPNAGKLTNSIRTLPYEQVANEEATDGYALYPKSRVTSPHSPVVVRQDGPSGPRYQEAVGYTFLINSVKFPGLARMDDGLLVLTLSMEIKEESKRVGLLLFSKDEGRTWSQPRRIPVHRTKPIALDGKKLLLGNLLSDDAGQTWSELKPLPSRGPDGRIIHISDLAYTPLVEAGDVTFVGWTPLEGYARWKSGELFTQGVLWRFHPDTQTWDEPYYFPKSRALNEGSLTRAKNGDLIAAFRTQMIGVPIDSDHWMGLATMRSTDEGKTWSEPAHHFLYGAHHCNLLTLPDGRILMTYAARIGELEGRTYHGVEAVFSHDHGAHWDWRRRYILFRWPNQGPHSPQSVALSDGRILTVFMHDTQYSWTDSDRHPYVDKVNLAFVGNVSVVIWSSPLTER